MPSSDPNFSLPDPETHPEFYASVPTKRLIAWVVDFILVLIPSLILFLATVIPLVLTVFGVFLIPAMMLFISFFYRWIFLSSGSATPGMRLMAIELRESDGSRLRGSTALYHTLGYHLSMAIPLAQVASVAMMLTSARGQGLSDMVLDTAMINRPARGW